MGIVDCYVDEPSIFGVPPYISPYPRYAWGAVADTGNQPMYATVDSWRKKEHIWKKICNAEIVFFTGGALVPGKYVRTMPASMKELIEMAMEVSGKKILSGPVARFSYTGGIRENREKLEDIFDYVAHLDGEAALFDLLTGRGWNERRRTIEEWNRWSLLGAECVRFAENFPDSVIAEIETYKGCVRWISGGCSFCTDVLFGEVVFREIDGIVSEIEAIYNQGLRNFRIGGQTCIYSYMAKGVGETETPTPNPNAIKRLFDGIWHRCPKIEVLHLDNANPAVIAEHEKEAREVTKILVEKCTPGNVVAFGMESADPEVIKRNNLNATPEQVMRAIEIVNEYGRARGDNGLPALLPGINFLGGLDGETKNTYILNYRFLQDVLAKNLWLRRINIRQVAGVRRNFRLKHRREFQHFKHLVRKNIDFQMLKMIVPENTVIRKIWTEMHEGKNTFGRQLASYPLLVGFPYFIEQGKFVDGIVVGHGERSITCIEYPLDVNRCSLAALQSVPGISKRIACEIIAKRPFTSEEFKKFLQSSAGNEIAKKTLVYFGLGWEIYSFSVK
ncbi:MAG: radical SAM protein [Thermoplasmata archaeon]